MANRSWAGAKLVWTRSACKIWKRRTKSDRYDTRSRRVTRDNQHSYRSKCQMPPNIARTQDNSMQTQDNKSVGYQRSCTPKQTQSFSHSKNSWDIYLGQRVVDSHLSCGGIQPRNISKYHQSKRKSRPLCELND